MTSQGGSFDDPTVYFDDSKCQVAFAKIAEKTDHR